MILFHPVNIYLFRNLETGFNTNIDKTFSCHSVWGVDVDSGWRRGGSKWIWAFTLMIAGLEPDSVFLLLMYNYKLILFFKSNQTSYIQFSSVAQSCPTLCDPMNRSTRGLPVHHQLSESTQTHVHWVGDVIQPSHPLSSPSPPAFNFSQHQGLFKWVSSSHQTAKVLEFQLQHQSFQWTLRTDIL